MLPWGHISHKKGKYDEKISHRVLGHTDNTIHLPYQRTCRGVFPLVEVETSRPK